MMIESMSAAIEFYKTILGFKIVLPSSTKNNEDLAWALLRKGDVQIMFQPIKSLRQEFPEDGTRNARYCSIYQDIECVRLKPSMGDVYLII
ncbi:MAG: hypothetical protein ABIN93_18545 [Ginsengibacter sp.]